MRSPGAFALCDDRNGSMLLKKPGKSEALGCLALEDYFQLGAAVARARLGENSSAEAHALHTAGSFGGGCQIRAASVLRFCTMAARWNSSRAPVRPLSRMRSKR